MIRCVLSLALSVSQTVLAAERTQHFDQDPNWEGVNNHLTRDHYPTVIQDFGYSSDTNIAGQANGEIGGRIHRSSTKAYYAMPIEPVTFDTPFRASGTFAVTKTGSSTGIAFGWFDHDFPAGARPMKSVLFNINGENGGTQMFVRVITARNSGAGAQVLNPGGGKHDFLFKPDGTRHQWAIRYEPADKGTITVHFDKLAPIVFELPANVRQDGLRADRFGLVNAQKSGGPMTFYLDDLKVGVKAFDFASDPNWESAGSHATFEDRELSGLQDFGYSETGSAGGEKRGEIGGTVWRTERPLAWYADRVGPLDLTRSLHASGKIILKIGAPDSGVYFGWFNSNGKEQAEETLTNFVGVRIEGPTRVGHYFAPIFAASNAQRRHVEKSAVVTPGEPHTFAIDYDPSKRQLSTTLDGVVTTLIIRPEDQQAGAIFNRFGFRSVQTGGMQVKLWIDDLTYTAD